jgi:hypothetical protein
LKEIWPLFGLFFIFQDLAFFETAYGQIWPFLKLLMAKFGLLNLFGPGNPVSYDSLVDCLPHLVTLSLQIVFEGNFG